jgi:phage-related protein
LGLLRTTLTNIKDDLGIAVIPAFNGLLQAIIPLVKRYAPGLIEVAKSIVDWLAKMAEGIAVVAPSLEDIVESFAALAAGDFSTFLEGIYGIGEALGIPRETLLQVVDGVADFGFQVKGLVDEVLPVVQETIATVLETIKALWDEHGKTVIGLVGSLWGFVVGTVKMNVDYVLGYLRTWWSLLTGDWEGAQKGIQQVTDAFWAQIQNVTETVLDILAQLFGWNRDEVTTTVNDLFAKARATFNEGLETIKLWVSTALEFVRSWWAKHGDEVMATIGAMWEWAQQAFSDALAWIRKAVSDALTFIRNWWDEHGANVMTIINTM